MNNTIKRLATSLAAAFTLGIAASTPAHAELIPQIDVSTPWAFTASLSETGLFSDSFHFYLGSGNELRGLALSDAPLTSFIVWLTGGDIVDTLYPILNSLSTNPESEFSTAKIAFSGLSAGDYTLHISAQGDPGAEFTTLVSANVATVPEPETLALLLASLGVMSAVARRRSATQTS